MAPSRVETPRRDAATAVAGRDGESRGVRLRGFCERVVRRLRVVLSRSGIFLVAHAHEHAKQSSRRRVVHRAVKCGGGALLLEGTGLGPWRRQRGGGESGVGVSKRDETWRATFPVGKQTQFKLLLRHKSPERRNLLVLGWFAVGLVVIKPACSSVSLV